MWTRKTSKKERKKSKKLDKSILGSGKGAKISIEAAPKFKYIHVCNLHPSLGEEILTQHLVANGFSEVNCKKLDSRRPDEYSSFKVGVPSGEFEALKHPDIWPEGSRINNFLLHLSRRKRREF